MGEFADIEELAEQCRFNDCGHEMEPGCAVQEAIEAAGSVRPLESYRKLVRELRSIEVRSSSRLRSEEKRRWRARARESRAARRYQGRTE